MAGNFCEFKPNMDVTTQHSHCLIQAVNAGLQQLKMGLSCPSSSCLTSVIKPAASSYFHD